MMHGLPLCLSMRVESAAHIVTGHRCTGFGTGRTVANIVVLDLRLSECSITAMDCIQISGRLQLAFVQCLSDVHWGGAQVVGVDRQFTDNLFSFPTQILCLPTNHGALQVKCIHPWQEHSPGITEA
jgi:hypothetical protein